MRLITDRRVRRPRPRHDDAVEIAERLCRTAGGRDGADRPLAACHGQTVDRPSGLEPGARLCDGELQVFGKTKMARPGFHQVGPAALAAAAKVTHREPHPRIPGLHILRHRRRKSACVVRIAQVVNRRRAQLQFAVGIAALPAPVGGGLVGLLEDRDFDVFDAGIAQAIRLGGDRGGLGAGAYDGDPRIGSGCRPGQASLPPAVFVKTIA